MNKGRLNFGDFLSELTGQIYGKQYWPRLEITQKTLEGSGEPTVLVVIMHTDDSKSERFQIETIVLDLREDYRNIVKSVHLSIKAVTVLCRV